MLHVKVQTTRSSILFSFGVCVKPRDEEKQCCFFFPCDCLRNAPPAKGTDLPLATSFPVSSGRDGPRMKARVTAGARKQDRQCWECKDEPSASSCSWAAPGQGRAGCPARGVAQQGRSVQAHLHPPAPTQLQALILVSHPMCCPFCSRGPGSQTQAAPALSPLG